jgi:tetratricopeptide (TPR) repeat protein
MLIGIARGLIVITAGIWLAGCSTSTSFSNLLSSKSPNADASAAQASADPSTGQEPADASTPRRTVEETTGTVPPPLGVSPGAEKGLLGSDPYDELSLGKKHYRANDFGLAEKHFRKAVETHPRDAEAWLGLAASYDRLRRSGRPSRFSTTKATHTCCVATTNGRMRRSLLPNAKIQPTNTYRTTSDSSRTAIARARPSSRL